MPGLIIDGAVVPFDGHRVINWHDDPRLRLGEADGRKRKTRWVRSIILHTTKGIPGGADHRPQVIRAGIGPGGDAGVRVARYWSRDPKSSGAHLIVDFDRTVCCLADLRLEVAYHATIANEFSVGIEIVQGAEAELYSSQLDAVCELVDLLTLTFGIQRQIPAGYRNRPLERFGLGPGIMVGVFGHRDVTNNRGQGDPGDEIMRRLARRGYQRLDYDRNEDLEVWRIRQREMGLKPDGIPGPRTIAELVSRGFAGGLWACPPRRPA